MLLPPASSAGLPALSADGAQSARLLQRAARQMHPIYGSPGTRQAGWAVFAPTGASATNIQQTPFEFSALVDGRVSSGGEDMLMLRVGGEGGTSLDAIIPHDFSAPWLDSGSQVRLIAHPSPQGQTGGDLASRADCAVVAAAPEAEVLLLEHPRLAASAYRPTALAPQTFTPSRAEFYSRTETRAAAPTLNLPPGHPLYAMSQQALAAYPYYRDQIHRLNRRLDDLSLDKITSSILGYSERYRIDPRLIVAMIIAESHFDPNSVSRTGAIGLGQLMPSTAAGMGVDPRDLELSIGASVQILSSHVAQYGGTDSQGLVPVNTLLLTMAAYNAGGGAVRRYHGVPPYRETQAYVHRVASYYRQLCGT